MGACALASVTLAAVLSATEWAGVPDDATLWLIVLVEGNAATPALGATLFVLAVELGTARERALALVERASSAEVRSSARRKSGGAASLRDGRVLLRGVRRRLQQGSAVV